MVTPISASEPAPLPSGVRKPGFGLELDQILGPTASGGGTPTSTTGPFDLVLTPSSPGNMSVAMIPGTINSVIPSNYLSIPDIADTGTFYFVLSVTVVNGQIATASVALNGSAPSGIPVTLATPPTSFDFLVGVVQDGIWFRSAPSGSFTATPFETYRVGLVNPAPGTLPYEIYYSWSVA